MEKVIIATEGLITFLTFKEIFCSLGWVVLARLVAAYISDWCKTGTGQTRKYSAM